MSTTWKSEPLTRFRVSSCSSLQRYGMILADNGTDWVVTGTPDPRWNNEQLLTLNRVKGSDFQVVDTRSLRP